MMSLFVSSHYKNSPNDLLLMADAPAHHLLVLLPPIDPAAATAELPEILVAIQISMEGAISKETVVRESLKDEQQEVARKVNKKFAAQHQELLSSLTDDLAVAPGEDEISAALGGKAPTSGTLSLRKRAADDSNEPTARKGKFDAPGKRRR